MTAKIRPGRRLRKALDAAVEARELEWSPTDLAVTLPLIEATADRVEVLRQRFAEEAERDGPLAVRAVQCAGELRQLENQLARLAASLGLDEDDDDEPPRPTSARHIAAGQARWSSHPARRRNAAS